MTALKCDRCGKLFVREYVPDITVRKYTHGYGECRIDLCPDCQKELEQWLKFKFDGERREKVINDLNVAKLILCNPQRLAPEMCIRVGQAITSAINLLKEQEPPKEDYNAV